MLVRIVKLEFEPQNVSLFLETFNTTKNLIRNYPGCTHLELFKDTKHPYRFFTYSKWHSVDDLESYRKSELFNTVWSKTKPLFANKAEAWSVDVVSSLE